MPPQPPDSETEVHVFENDGELRVHPPTVTLNAHQGVTDDLDRQ